MTAQKHDFCSHGLLSLAQHGIVDYATDETTDVLAGIIREQFPERIAPGENNSAAVIRFNDHLDTTFADVERVFEKAEVAWDERI